MHTDNNSPVNFVFSVMQYSTMEEKVKLQKPSHSITASGPWMKLTPNSQVSLCIILSSKSKYLNFSELSPAFHRNKEISYLCGTRMHRIR